MSIDENLQRRLKEQSMSGESGKKDPNRKIRMKYKDYKRTIAAVAIAASIATGVVIGGGAHVTNQLKDSFIVNSMCTDFRKDCISKETHRTYDLQYYYYDYPDIASYIESMDDYDLGVYLCHQTIGEHQTDQVMRCTDYRSYENFLEAHGYKDTKDLRKYATTIAVLTDEVDKKNEEIARMREEHPELIDESNIDKTGGAK